jgi:hypothetical protein
VARSSLSLTIKIKAKADHDELMAVMDVGNRKQLAEDSSAMGKKKLVSGALLELLRLDKELGREMLDSYRLKWLLVVEHPETDLLNTLDE